MKDESLSQEGWEEDNERRNTDLRIYTPALPGPTHGGSTRGTLFVDRKGSRSIRAMTYRDALLAPIVIRAR